MGHDSVCKLYLVGFCPENEKLFHNTRRDLGACPKSHLEIHKREFDEHPDKKKYQAANEVQLLKHLTSILRRCDEWTAREKQKNEEFLMDKKGYGAVAPSQEANKMKEKASKLLNEAEEMAAKGDIEASKTKVTQAQEYEKKAADWEEKVFQMPQICDICGGIKESEKRSAFKHEEGKVHKGILMMMDMHKDMKKREAKGELKVDGDIVDEEEKLREDEARERRREDREKRERDDKERRKKERERREREREEERQREKEREQRERDLRERRRKERENPTRDRSRSRSRDRRDTSRDRDRDRDRRDDKKDDKKEKAGSDDEKKDDKDKVSTQERFKQRAIQKQFMDLLVKSRIVTATSTYKDLEKQLGDKDEWKACDADTREDLANEFIECIKGIGA